MIKPVPAVVFANANLAMTPQAAHSPEWLGEFVRQTGYSGVEYTPFYDLIPDHDVDSVARAVRNGSLVLNSFHASFRACGESRDTNKLPGENVSRVDTVMSSVIGRLLMPEMRESAFFMREVSRGVGRQFPTVLYPQAQRSEDMRQQDIAESSLNLFQPTDHVASLIGKDTLEDFDYMMRESRRYGYVFDTFHARRTYGGRTNGPISDVEKSVPFLAPHVQAVHLSLARTDITGEPHIPTLQECRDATEGRFKGELGFMLDVLKESGSVEYIVVEATARSVNAATGGKGLPGAKMAYANIAQGLKDYWAA